MGVIYKLKDEVVQFIISQRQSNPLASCRQLAESASQKFSLNLSKSSVHDVLKESGIITPRGRKPKYAFEIPQEKKKEIQASLSQVKLLPDLAEFKQESLLTVIPAKAGIHEMDKMDPHFRGDDAASIEISPEYEEAGRIFLKAVFWDLGIFSEENIKATDWNYYLTYSKGIKVVLENNQSFFIDLPLPLDRCIREMADGLINNVKPLMVHKVSDERLFKACMEAQPGFKIETIAIVDYKDHIIFKLDNIMEYKRNFIIINRVFMESNEKDSLERIISVFFPQLIDNKCFIEYILSLKGFDTINKDEKSVTLLIDDSYENKSILQEAAEKLNGMFLRDEQDRLISIKIQARSLS